jgi:hypothetical protein
VEEPLTAWPVRVPKSLGHCEQVIHVASQNRHSATIAGLRGLRGEVDETSFQAHLRPPD